MIVGAYEATLCLDGQPSEEHKTECKPGSGRAYVVSVTGKKISVGWKKDVSHPGAVPACVGDVLFDELVLARLLLDGGHTDAIVTGQPISAGRERPFVFSTIATSDRDEYRQSAPLPDGFGTIELRLYHVKVGAESPSNTYDTALFPYPILHEKSVKKRKVTHRTAYAPSRPCPPFGPDRFFEYKDPDEKPFVTFTFVYRSKAMLQADKILPPDVKRKSESIETITIDSDDTDDDPEVASVLDRLKAVRAAARKRAKDKRASEGEKAKSQHKG